MSNNGPLFLGLDLGTSGCRAVTIDESRRIVAATAAGYAAQLDPPEQWWRAVGEALAQLPRRGQVRALAVAGTSSTTMLCRADGSPASAVLRYDDARATEASQRLRKQAGDHPAAAPTSALAKAIWLQAQASTPAPLLVAQQADWIMGRLTGRWAVSDYNNALKLGYDLQALAWPAWLAETGLSPGSLPEVVAPGALVGTLAPALAAQFRLPPDCEIRAGTTDGVAAFLAAGADAPGEAVTSLGSTLVLKMLSNEPVQSAAHGVYSHRLGERWLAGGASNAGGAVLRAHFSDAQMRRLSADLDPEHPTGLDYYPLLRAGERFPVADPALAPKTSPRPESDTRFFQGLLEGLTAIEARGYTLLTELGAPPLRSVRTTGGGSHNAPWREMRNRALGVPIVDARCTQAAFGAALLAVKSAEESESESPLSRSP